VKFLVAIILPPSESSNPLPFNSPIFVRNDVAPDVNEGVVLVIRSVVTV